MVFTAENDAGKSFLDTCHLSGKGTKAVVLYTDPQLTNLYNASIPLYQLSDNDFFTKEGERYIYEEWVSYNPITRAALAFMQGLVGKTIEMHPLLFLVKTFHIWWD